LLETFGMGCSMCPMYLTKAAFLKDPVEKLKYVIISQLSTFYITSNFLKPLNPILGETFNAEFEDGTKYYAEQTTHHPPVSHFLLVGPDECYKYGGYGIFAAHPSFNSITVNVTGTRTIIFHDGTKVVFNNSNVTSRYIFFVIIFVGIL
jgi:hypothetical protein